MQDSFGRRPSVTVCIRSSAEVGEGPHYDPGRDELTWVDIPAGAVHVTGLTTGRTTTTTVPVAVGAAVRSRTGHVLATAHGFASLDARGYRPRVDLLGPGERMNDAKCDPFGRLWAGSCAWDFTAGAGRLHVLHPDWSTSLVLSGLTLPNGMGWSPEGRTFYLIDSIRRELWSFGAPSSHGEPKLTDRRLVHHFDEDGVPDGLAVDTEGCLWVAVWGAAHLVRISPDGEVLLRVTLPVAQPSSCAFAGPDLETLLVTSARAGLGPSPEDRVDGSVVAVTDLGTRGVAVANGAHVS